MSNILNIISIWHKFHGNHTMGTEATDCLRGADVLMTTLYCLSVESFTGTQNYSGLSVFSAAPAEVSIAPGQSQDVTVTFQPDHPSVYYSDRLTIELMNKVSRADTHTLTCLNYISLLHLNPLPAPCVSD